MSYTKSYIRYIKSQSEEVKNIHSVFIASLLTGVFAVVYLYAVRGITPRTPDINITKEYTYTNPDAQNNGRDSIINESDAADTSTYNAGDISQINSDIKNKNSASSNISGTTNPFQTILDIISKATADISQIKNSLGESEYKVQK